MRKLFVLLALFTLCTTTWASNSQTTSAPAGSSRADSELTIKKKVYRGYSGGMMLHVGGLFDPTGNAGGIGSDFSAAGFTKGIGGAIKIHLWDHFKIGTEGYVSTMGMKNDGYLRTFWSGLLFEGYAQGKRVSPFGGVTLGGGGTTSYYMFEGSSHDWEPEANAVFHKSPFFALDPYVGIEVAITKAFRLSFKLDWLLAIRKTGIGMPQGPRFYVGFFFGH